MNSIFDRGILFLFSFFYLFHTKTDVQFVIGFLIAVIFSFAEEYFVSEKPGKLICYLALPFLLLFPPLIMFFPVIAYSCFRRKRYLVILLGLFLSFHYFVIIHGSPFYFYICFFGVLLSLCLHFNTSRFQRLNEKYIHTIDNDREQQLALAQKNHILMENQDYEIYAATLQERNRIAREIHDNVGHLLSRSILLVGAMKIINKNDALKTPLDNLDESLNSAMTSIRSSVHDLHDEAVNLSDAIHDLVDSFEFCPVELKYDIGRNVPKEVKYAFISITKEALTNIIKHSNATKVSVLLREQPVLYQLRIKDNGTVANINESGIGLSNMKERITLLHGNFQINTENGFEIFITIPKGDD